MRGDSSLVSALLLRLVCLCGEVWVDRPVACLDQLTGKRRLDPGLSTYMFWKEKQKNSDRLYINESTANSPSPQNQIFPLQPPVSNIYTKRCRPCLLLPNPYPARPIPFPTHEPPHLEAAEPPARCLPCHRPPNTEAYLPRPSPSTLWKKKRRRQEGSRPRKRRREETPTEATAPAPTAAPASAAQSYKKIGKKCVCAPRF